MKNSLILAVVIGVVFLGYSRLNANKYHHVTTQLPELIKNGAIIIDVRTRPEFQAASNPKSINIPLDELDTKSATLNKNKPIILCCRSGRRSGMALNKLKAKGFTKLLNAGPWQNTM